MSFLPHLAFDLHPIVAKVPYKVTEMAVMKDRVYLATTEGLLVYAVTARESSFGADLLYSDKRFCRKLVTKMDILEREQLLFALAETLTVHDISDPRAVRLVATIAKGKGALLFAVDCASTVPRVVIAQKKKLILLSMRSSSEFADAGELSLPDVPKMIHFCADNVCVGFKKDYSVVRLLDGAVSDVCATGRAANPLATPLPEQQMLLFRDNIGVFAYYDGRAAGRVGVSFSEPPVAVAYRFPFVVAALPRAIEVRGVGGAHGLAQQLPARDVRWLVAGDSSGDDDVPVYAASATGLWRLCAVPLANQCERLVRERRFDEALSLCDAIPVDSHDRADRLRRIKGLFAHHLFATGKFERALGYLGELRTFPLDVLALYDGLLPVAAAADCQARLDKDQRAGGVVAARSQPLRGHDKTTAYAALIGYLNGVRGEPINLGDVDGVPVKQVPYAETLDVPTILDTSLLKAYLIAAPDKLETLLDSVNAVDVVEGERALFAAEKHAALVQLYFSKGMHRKALDLLSKLAHGRTALSGFEPTIAYLSRLDRAHADLVFQYSKPALQAVPSAALRIFCVDRAERVRLPREDVLNHLRTVSPQLVQEYLEFVLQRSQWVETRPEFHDQLVGEYLNTVLALKRNQPRREGGGPAVRVKAGSEPGLLGATRQKLLAILDSSQYYHAEALLAKFPLDDLYEERAVLLQKLGQHEAALSIYVHTLGDMATAEAYCARQFLQKPDSDVYLALLRVCVVPPPGEKKDTVAALKLVNRHAGRIDPAAALALLDDGVLVQELIEFFTHALCNRTADSREATVVHSLQRSAHRHAKQHLLTERARARVITRMDVCKVCSKRIGAAAFALLHSDEVVHYMCVGRLDVDLK